MHVHRAYEFANKRIYCAAAAQHTHNWSMQCVSLSNWADAYDLFAIECTNFPEINTLSLSLSVSAPLQLNLQSGNEYIDAILLKTICRLWVCYEWQS